MEGGQDNVSNNDLSHLSLISYLPLSRSERQSTREIFSVITFSFGSTVTTSFVQLSSLCKQSELDQFLF